MKHVGKRVAGALLALTLAVGVLPVYEVQAAALSAKTKKVYRQCLNAYLYDTDWPEQYIDDKVCTPENTRFALVDLNGDGKKELYIEGSNFLGHIAVNNAYMQNGKPLKVTSYVHWGTVKKNKLKKKTESCKGVNSPICKITRVSGKGFETTFYSSAVCDYGDVYYIFKANGIPEEVAFFNEYYDPSTNAYKTEYWVKGKKTTKANYDKVVKSLGKMRDITTYEYTYQNINKYLK